MYSSNHSTLLLIISFVLLWNSGFIGAEYGLPYAGPFTLLFWRYSVLVFLLSIYLLLRGRFRRPGILTFTYTVVTGILAHGVWLSCVLVSLQQGVPAGIVALVVALQPMATGAFSGWILGEYTRPSQWLGLVIGFAGVALAVGFRVDLSEASSLVNYSIPLGSVIAITVASLLQRWSSAHRPDYHLPVDSSLFYQSLGTAIAVAIPAIAIEGLETQWNTAFVGTLAWLTLAVSLVAYGLMWVLLARLDATRVASLFYLGPPTTMIMAWVTLGETPQLMDGLGMLVVSLGVLVVQHRDDSQVRESSCEIEGGL